VSAGACSLDSAACLPLLAACIAPPCHARTALHTQQRPSPGTGACLRNRGAGPGAPWAGWCPPRSTPWRRAPPAPPPPCLPTSSSP
jgi:hypothetical protein